MNTIYGMPIVVSPLLRDRPVIEFRTNALGFTTPAIDAFNTWLGEQFGHQFTFLRIGDKIVTNERGLRAIREATYRRAKEWLNGLPR